MSTRPLLAAASGLALLLLTACGSTTPTATTEPDPTVAPVAECPAPQPNAYGGAAVLLDSAELLGADDLPADVCAYGSESGESIWIIAQPYDAAFPDRVAAWLEPLGWTFEEVGAWGDDETAETNYAFTAPAGLEINQAFAHSFEAQPDSVSFNFGIDQEFLDRFAQLGEPLAIFTAYL